MKAWEEYYLLIPCKPFVQENARRGRGCETEEELPPPPFLYKTLVSPEMPTGLPSAFPSLAGRSQIPSGEAPVHSDGCPTPLNLATTLTALFCVTPQFFLVPRICSTPSPPANG